MPEATRRRHGDALHHTCARARVSESGRPPPGEERRGSTRASGRVTRGPARQRALTDHRVRQFLAQMVGVPQYPPLILRSIIVSRLHRTRRITLPPSLRFGNMRLLLPSPPLTVLLATVSLDGTALRRSEDDPPREHRVVAEAAAGATAAGRWRHRSYDRVCRAFRCRSARSASLAAGLAGTEGLPVQADRGDRARQHTGCSIVSRSATRCQSEIQSSP